MSDLEIATPVDGLRDAVDVVRAIVRVKKNANTREAYRRDMWGCNHDDPAACEHPKRQPNPFAWLRWCAARGLNPLAAQALHIEAWLRDLDHHAGESDGTRARRFASVRGFYKMALRLGKVQANPADLVDENNRPRWREPGTTGTALDTDQRLDLSEAAEESGVRDAALIAVALYTGLRASELSGINIEDITVQGKRMAIAVRGKGGRDARIWLDAETRKKVEALLAQPRPDTNQLPALAAVGRPEPRPLFVGVRGKRMSRQSIGKVVAKLSTGLGLPQRIGVHDIRRTFGTAAVQVTDLHSTQKAMRHKDPKTTTTYLHLNPEKTPGELVREQDERARRERTDARTSTTSEEA